MDFWLILEWEICSQRQNPVCFPTLTHSWGRGRGSRNSFFKKKARVKFEIDKLGRCCWILEMLQGGQIEEIRIRNQSHCQKAGDTAFFPRCPVGWDTPLTWNLIGLENPEPRAEAKTCSQKRGQGVGEQVDGGCCGLTSIGICMALLEAALCQKVTSVFGTQVNFFLGVGGAGGSDAAALSPRAHLLRDLVMICPCVTEGGEMEFKRNCALHGRFKAELFLSHRIWLPQTAGQTWSMVLSSPNSARTQGFMIMGHGLLAFSPSHTKYHTFDTPTLLHSVRRDSLTRGIAEVLFSCRMLFAKETAEPKSNTTNCGMEIRRGGIGLGINSPWGCHPKVCRRNHLWASTVFT